MMQELKSKNTNNGKTHESQGKSEDSEETEVSKNHLRKLESMAKNISLANKSKREASKKNIKKEEEPNEKAIESNRASPKSKSIQPSESYAQNIGFGKQVNSPLIANNRVSSVKSKQKKREEKEESTTAKKQVKPNSSVPLKRDQRKGGFGNKQAKLHQKYTQKNAMTHTPNPKVGTYNPTAHSRKSQTPEPKAASNLINNLNREPLIKEKLTERKYCLVLDLDETLIHFRNDNGRAKFLIRPYTYNFLRNLEPHYELIIFTAAQKEYADWILDKIDNKVSQLIPRNSFLIDFIERTVS
jgi:hypothetical protein